MKKELIEMRNMFLEDVDGDWKTFVFTWSSIGFGIGLILSGICILA